MPDAAGKLYFIDYVNELMARGFDGFSAADLKGMVNRGYFHVARKNRWVWEQTTDSFTVAAGSVSVDLWPVPSGELPYFRSLDKLYCVTSGQQRRMRPSSDDVFFKRWLPLDLTASSNRGEPDHYYILENKLYILAPPSSNRDFIAHYHRRVAAMVGDNDQPITPQHLDEAILLAALIRTHQRSNEPQLAAVVAGDLEEIFDDMRDDEEKVMAEQPTRVSPDDTWL